MLVNETYRPEISEVTDIPERIDVEDFKDDNQRPRIVKRLETFFERYYINEGEFEHYAPAKYFEDNRDLLKDRLDDQSLDNFEEVFSEFNSILDNFD
jgi:arginyl-tRNA--protein-N-Asp/Glu arginylyltransferase